MKQEEQARKLLRAELTGNRGVGHSGYLRDGVDQSRRTIYLTSMHRINRIKETLHASDLFVARRFGRHLVVELLTAHRVLSTSARGGGQQDELRYLVNHQSCEARGDVARQELIRRLGLVGYHDHVCKEALRWQNGLEPSCIRGLFHALGRFGLTEERALSGLAGLLPEEQHAFLQKNRKAVFFAPGVAAAAYAFAAVLDRIAFGTLPPGIAQESLRQQAASLACSLAARPQDWPLFRHELAETGEVPDDTMDLVIRALALGWKSKWA